MSGTRNYDEYEIQCQFEEYLLSNHPKILAEASPLGVDLPIQKATMLKRKGCRASYPDHKVYVRKKNGCGNIYGMAFFEFKAPGKRVVKGGDQEQTLLALVRAGFFVRVVDSLESAIESLEAYLALEDAPEVKYENKSLHEPEKDDMQESIVETNEFECHE